MAAKISSLMSSIRQLEASAAGANVRPSRAKKGNKKALKLRETTVKAVGAARSAHPQRIGLTDLTAHRISWICGYTYAGLTATKGTSGSVYFRTNTGSLAVITGQSNAQIPILSSNVDIGASFITDIKKHYSRQRVRSLKLTLVPLQPSTAVSAQVYVGPLRSYGTADTTFLSAAGGTVGQSIQNVLSMSGSRNCASWETMSLDLTPYIAGGSGGRQNEFNIQASNVGVWGTAADFELNSPAGFCIGGSVATASLYGTDLHMVVIEEIVDLLDFTGAVVMTAPEGFVADQKVAFEQSLRLLAPPKVQEDYDYWQKCQSGKIKKVNSC